MNDIFGEGTLI